MIHRTEHKENFTVISNAILFDERLSHKVRCLMLIIISLPDNWSFNKRGLMTKSGLKRNAFDNALAELKDCGYIQIDEHRKSNGEIAYDWNVYENPVADKSNSTKPHPDNQSTANPQLINTNPQKTDKQNIDLINTNQSINRENCEAVLKANIEYDHLIQNYKKDEIDGILNILTYPFKTKNDTVRVGGDEILTSEVQAQYLKLDSTHIEYVLECLRKTTTEIKNHRAYMATALYNAPDTIDQYYRNQVNHDFAMTGTAIYLTVCKTYRKHGIRYTALYIFLLG